MNFLKRAALSVIRRPGKTLILFIVILIIGNLMAGVVAVRQAISQSEDIAKHALGATVSIGIDDQALSQAYAEGKEPMVNSLGAETIEGLGSRPEVKSFDYSLMCGLASRSLKNYSPDGGGAVFFGSSARSVTVTPASYEAEPESEPAPSYYFTLRGIRYAPVMPIEEGKLSLVEGRVFKEEEISGSRLVALISDKLAEANNLHVGDVIVFTNEILSYPEFDSSSPTAIPEPTVVDSHDLTLEVIGIFTPNYSDKDISADDASSGIELDQMFDYETYNTIYIPIGVAQAEDKFVQDGSRKIAELAGESWPEQEYEPYYTPLYTLNSIDDIDSFIQAASGTLPEYYMVHSAKSQFEQIAGPMVEIQRIMTASIIVAAIAGLIIISLLTVLFLRDRRKEFGVYISLGVRKLAIISQVLLEVLVVALIALAISLFTGSFISDGLSQQLITNQLSSHQGYGAYGGFYIGGDANLMMGNLSLDSIISSYQTSINATYILTFLGLGLGVTALSCIAPLLYVLRLKPKKVLM
jgi:putative ABC transport system permease protein